MGVTLEKVQFKFASIIGELCSEPQILSQFAVWLDMRLAEFKLKGSISLDCSGDPVPPEWLEGIEEAMAAQMSRKRNHKAQKVTTIPDDDDDIIITGSHEIVSASRRVNMGGNSSQDSNQLSNENRKRTYQTLHVEGHYESNPKNHCLSMSSDSGIMSNQSLISILTDQADSHHDLSQSRSMPTHNTTQYNTQSQQEEQFVVQNESEFSETKQSDNLSQYFQSNNDKSSSENQSPSNSAIQSERGNSLYLNSFPYAAGCPQRRERSIWSPEEKAAIHTYLLPIVQRTRKPPTKSEIQDLTNREPVLRHRHWEKIKFQAWSLYQSHVRRQNNLTAESHSRNRDSSAQSLTNNTDTSHKKSD